MSVPSVKSFPVGLDTYTHLKDAAILLKQFSESFYLFLTREQSLSYQNSPRIPTLEKFWQQQMPVHLDIPPNRRSRQLTMLHSMKVSFFVAPDDLHWLEVLTGMPNSFEIGPTVTWQDSLISKYTDNTQEKEIQPFGSHPLMSMLARNEQNQSNATSTGK